MDVFFPGDQPLQLHPHLLHLHERLDTLVQAVSGLVSYLRAKTAPSAPAVPPSPDIPMPFPHHLHTVLPERYRGDLDGCCHFVLACELPEMTLAQKVSLIIQCLRVRAYDWAVAVWRGGGGVPSPVPGGFRPQSVPSRASPRLILCCRVLHEFLHSRGGE